LEPTSSFYKVGGFTLDFEIIHCYDQKGLRENEMSTTIDLIQKNKGLVEYIAKEHYRKKNIPNYFEQEDVIGYAYVGLLEALRTFNESKGIKFRTYAKHRIHGAVIDGIWGNSYKRQIVKETDFYEISLDDLLIDEEFDVPCDEDKVNKIFEKQIIGIIDDYIKQNLTEKERDVILYIYYCELSQNEICELMDISKGRVSQLHKSAIEKIRKDLFGNTKYS
jgi:RNA polymerase sigma factor for flagellar operon FliA